MLSEYLARLMKNKDNNGGGNDGSSNVNLLRYPTEEEIAIYNLKLELKSAANVILNLLQQNEQHQFEKLLNAVTESDKH